MGQLQFCDCYNNFFMRFVAVVACKSCLLFCNICDGQGNQMKFAASLENFCDKASKSKTTTLSSSMLLLLQLLQQLLLLPFAWFMYGPTTGAARKQLQHS